MGLATTIISNFDTFAGPIVMLLYPLIASIKAIETPSKQDDQQWLTYWVLYSFVTLVELSFWQIFSRIPFWGKVKLLGALWLVLPQFNGASFMYEYFVKNFVRNKLLKQNENDSNVTHHLERMMSGSARASVQQFIDDHGQDAFESVIAAATKEARKHKLSPRKERQERY